VEESENTPALAAALRAMADEDARIGASPDVEARLLDDVRAIAATRRRRARMGVLAIAAALLLALAVPSWRIRTRVPSGERIEEVTTSFMPLPYGSVPASTVHMVRIAVPRAALASFGLIPLDAVNRASTDTVVADVLVGDDGLARAVRFVRAATEQEQLP
jgi:hypothetical protein